MGSKKLGADINLAWPTAQIGVMGAQGAVNILYRRELAALAAEGGDVEARRAELIAKYEEELLNPYQAAELGYIDEVIAPSETRVRIISSLRALHDKRAATPRRSTATSRCKPRNDSVSTPMYRVPCAPYRTVRFPGSPEKRTVRTLRF